MPLPKPIVKIDGNTLTLKTETFTSVKADQVKGKIRILGKDKRPLLLPQSLSIHIEENKEYKIDLEKIAGMDKPEKGEECHIEVWYVTDSGSSSEVTSLEFNPSVAVGSKDSDGALAKTVEWFKHHKTRIGVVCAILCGVLLLLMVAPHAYNKAKGASKWLTTTNGAVGAGATTNVNAQLMQPVQVAQFLETLAKSGVIMTNGNVTFGGDSDNNVVLNGINIVIGGLPDKIGAHNTPTPSKQSEVSHPNRSRVQEFIIPNDFSGQCKSIVIQPGTCIRLFFEKGWTVQITPRDNQESLRVGGTNDKGEYSLIPPNQSLKGLSYVSLSVAEGTDSPTTVDIRPYTY